MKSSASTGQLLAKIISIVFNPFLMPAAGLWLMLNYLPGTSILGSRIRFLLYAIVLTTSCLLPLLFILILNINPNFNQRFKRPYDRLLPYFFTYFSIFLGAQLLTRLPVPQLFRVYLLVISLILVILFFISLKWKVSSHAAGIGLVTGTALALIFRYHLDLLWPMLVSILVAGIVGTSRIFLERQTLDGVISGFFVSCIFIYLAIFFT